MTSSTADVPRGGAEFSPWHHGFNSPDDLRRLRKLAGMSQRDLSGMTGLHLDTVKYWEGQSGRRLDGVGPVKMRTALETTGIVVPRPGEPAVTLPAPPRMPSTCGARNRHGSACQCKPMAGKRRCKYHGGMSTGPKTAAGLERIRAAMRARWHGVLSADDLTGVTTRG